MDNMPVIHPYELNREEINLDDQKTMISGMKLMRKLSTTKALKKNNPHRNKPRKRCQE